MKRIGYINLLLLSAVYLTPAHGGAIGGDAAKSDYAGFTNCDQRQRFIRCSYDDQQRILDKCYVAIHKENRLDCSWQSCGKVSIVGSKPTVTNRGVVIEYQVETPAQIKPDWNCQSGLTKESCLPKFPFPRHYLTVRQALELRKSSDQSEAAQTLRNVPRVVLESNPYLACANFAFEENANNTVWVSVAKTKNGKWDSSTEITWKVEKSQVVEACANLKKLGGSAITAECYVNKTAVSTGTPLSTYLKTLKP